MAEVCTNVLAPLIPALKFAVYSWAGLMIGGAVVIVFSAYYDK